MNDPPATRHGTNVMSYFLERSANPAAPSTLVATNILRQAGTTSYANTNATGAGHFYYRAGVRCP